MTFLRCILASWLKTSWGSSSFMKTRFLRIFLRTADEFLHISTAAADAYFNVPEPIIGRNKSTLTRLYALLGAQMSFLKDPRDSDKRQYYPHKARSRIQSGTTVDLPETLEHVFCYCCVFRNIGGAVHGQLKPNFSKVVRKLSLQCSSFCTRGQLQRNTAYYSLDTRFC